MSSNDTKQIKLMGFVKITGKIKLKTGLHIGGTADAIDKGGIDNPVIKNPVTNEPYIPGSSLRGRMRSLLEKKNGAELKPMTEKIYIEHYKDYSEAQQSEVCRMFGNSASDPGLPSVLVVRDAMLSNDYCEYKKSDYIENGLPVTEAKIETVIDRVTAHALPRTIERVPAGAVFDLEMVYKVQTYDDGKFEDSALKCNTKLREDINNIFWSLSAIQNHTGLGGNSSRGHGQIMFEDLKLGWESIDDGLSGSKAVTLSDSEYSKVVNELNFNHNNPTKNDKQE